MIIPVLFSSVSKGGEWVVYAGHILYSEKFSQGKFHESAKKWLVFIFVS